MSIDDLMIVAGLLLIGGGVYMMAGVPGVMIVAGGVLLAFGLYRVLTSK